MAITIINKTEAEEQYLQVTATEEDALVVKMLLNRGLNSIDNMPKNLIEVFDTLNARGGLAFILSKK